MLGEDSSLGVSEVELREELLLDSSFTSLLEVEVRWKKDVTRSLGSQGSSCWGSRRCFSSRSLAITWDRGMPNAWGAESVKRRRKETDRGESEFTLNIGP